MQRDNDSEPTEPSSDDQKPASLARMLTPAEMQELRQAQIDCRHLAAKGVSKFEDHETRE